MINFWTDLCVLALRCLLVWLLWNWLMPDIFGLKTISFWQAFGIIVLCAMVTRPTYEKKERQKIDVDQMLSNMMSGRCY